MEKFTNRANRLYDEQRDLGNEARQIITAFVQEHGGEYKINIDEDDHVWVGDEIYATMLTTENSNILVHNSGNFSEYLHDMDDYNILDLASYIEAIRQENDAPLLYKPTFSEEQHRMFARNFDRSTYENAKAAVLKAIKEAHSYNSLIVMLKGYDSEEYENEKSFFCEIELDRSAMETEADFVSVEFLIGWASSESKAKIHTARLCTTEGDIGQLCPFDPETCELLEWN